MKELLKIEHLKKSFDDLDVLKDISLTVKEGEVVAILGPSGSGKSTLLRCATMLETMDGGNLFYGEHQAAMDNDGHCEYAKKETLKKCKSMYSLVFQNFNLMPHFSVLKNVTHAPIHVQKRDKQEVLKQAKEILKNIGLGDKMDFYPSQLSGGQQQRVAIARALAMNPQMIFFDEPTSALDPEITAGILTILKELANQKMTMIIVTHEIDFARKVANRVVFMDGGVIVEEGAPEDVIDNPINERTKEFLQKMNTI